MNRVGNGVNATTISRSVFRKSSARSTRSNVVEQGVVVHPDDADREEAGHVCEVGRPDVQQLLAEVVRGASTLSSSTSSVIAIAKTPSLKASSRALVIAPS